MGNVNAAVVGVGTTQGGGTFAQVIGVVSFTLVDTNVRSGVAECVCR